MLAHVIVVRRGKLLLSLLGENQIALAIVAPHAEQAVCVGLQWRDGDPEIAFGTPYADFRVCDGLAAVGVQDESPEDSFPAALTHHQSQIADPEVGIRHLIVLISERRVVTGDEEEGAGRQIEDSRDFRDAFLVILRCRQIGRPSESRPFGQEPALFVAIQLFGTSVGPLELLLPVVRHHAEIDFVQVAVTDCDRRCRIVPDAFGGDLDRLGFDLLNQVVALPAADAFGETALALGGDAVCFGQIAFLMQYRRPGIQCASRDRGVGPLVGELPQRRFVASFLLIAKGLVVSELKPREVRVQECRPVVVVLVKTEQLLIKADALDRGRAVVRRLDLPFQEVLGG